MQNSVLFKNVETKVQLFLSITICGKWQEFELLADYIYFVRKQPSKLSV